MAEPKTKRKPAPKLTDAERHKRFVDMAKEVEASERQEDFDKAFKKVASVIKEPPKHPPEDDAPSKSGRNPR